MSMLVGCKLRPSQHGPYPRQQFVHTKGLGEIIIGTQIETTDLILILSTSGDNDDRDSGELTDALADGKAIHPGHHHVKQHQVRPMRFYLFKGLLTITGWQDLVALKLEIAR